MTHHALMRIIKACRPMDPVERQLQLTSNMACSVYMKAL